MISVLPSSKVVMLAVDQHMMALTYDCTERTRMGIVLERSDIIKCESSGNEWCVTECESTILANDVAYIVNM